MSHTTDASFIDAMQLLPDQYAARLSDKDQRWVRGAAAAGEWAEALEQLAAGLVHASATITRPERHALVELFTTAHADIEVLDEVPVQEN